MSIYHISRTLTYFISFSYHMTTYICSSFACRILIISYINTSGSYRFLTYHSSNVLIHITIISLQERIVTLSLYQSIIILSLSTHNLIVFFYQSIVTISFLSISHIHSTSIRNLTLTFHEHILLLSLHYV